MTPRGRHPGRGAWLLPFAHLFAALWSGACGADGRARTLTTPGEAAGKPSAAAAPASWRYEIAPDPDLAHLDVRACFDRPPAALVQEEGRAWGFLQATGEGLVARGRRLVVTAPDADGCVDYRVSLRRPDVRHPLADARADSVLLGAPLWLWGPESHAPGATGEITLRTGEVPVAAPWASAGGGWRLDPVAFVFDAAVVFGRRHEWTLAARDAEIRVVRVEPHDAPPDEAVRDWLRASAGAASSLFGAFPVRRAMFVILPVDERERPVEVGHAYRGGAASVVLRVSRHATREGLLGDPVAVHEMTHLGLPYVRHQDAWLSEGLATYYQEVLRARAGLVSRTDAWRALHDGIERARGEARGSTLRARASGMSAVHREPSVYWGGAAIALLVDVELRRRGLGTLDDVVRALSDCCAWPPRDWSAREIVARMDAVIGEPLVRTISERWLSSRGLPDLSRTWRWLGLREGSGGSLVALDDAPGAAVREGIVEGARGTVDVASRSPARSE